MVERQECEGKETMITPENANTDLHLSGSIFYEIIYRVDGQARDREDIMFIMDILNQSVKACTKPTSMAEVIYTAVNGR